MLAELRKMLGMRAGQAKPAGETKHTRFLADIERCSGSLRGKRLLEIGSDKRGEFLRYCVERGGALSATGVNPSIQTPIDAGPIQLLNVDARDMPFPDESFDVIGSLAVFEHVFGLNEVLEECHRVLKPGGCLYSEFGPIWSACWGHHLALFHDGEQVDWRTHKLPPYAHLLMTKPELERWCDEQFGKPELSRKISEFVHDSPDQNRLFFSDYVEAFTSSPFQIVFLRGSPDVPHPEGTPQVDYAATFNALRERYPGKDGFGYHLIGVLLKKA